MKAYAASAILFVLAWVAWVMSATPTAGELLYRQGILPEGRPLQGQRKDAPTAEGTAAACINCHRRSGLGTVEGRVIVPPITGRYLYSIGIRDSRPDEHPAHVEPTPRDRRAYTDATLARAIREGIGPDGRTLNYLMPRYELDDATMTSLVAYLKNLSRGPVPGVGEDTLQFATIVTPDADPVKRKAMLDVLNRFFELKNAFYRGESPSALTFYKYRIRMNRKWSLHVWELNGPPETWQQQLHERQQREPVFAIISGIGGKTWAPVHKFCQDEAIPCLMPNVDLPVVAESDFYDVYFSKGVLLEAQLIAVHLQKTSAHSMPRRLVQVFREGDVGAAAASELRSDVEPIRLDVVDRELKAGASREELTAALKKTKQGDAVVLWLRPEDLRSLSSEKTGGQQWYISGIMGGLERAPLSGALRGNVNMTYPFELPEKRAVLMNYPLGWFRLYQIPVVDERIQTDTYIACSILSETIKLIEDNFVRDYLVEQVESMLSVRIIDGYYPRLGLAPGQSFASKGGYIVRFAQPDGKELVAETGWIVP